MAGKKIKAVVTGGAGFIGSHLVDALVEEGFDVHVVDDLSGGAKENVNEKAILHVLDVRDLEAIMPVFKGAEYVFHLAALPKVQFSIENPIEADDINVRGTLNVLLASGKSGVKKVIYSASCSAYGDQKIIPIVESALINPKSPYGLHKYIGELYCRLWSDVYKLPTVSLRYFNVYGPRQDDEGAYASVIVKFFKQKREGSPMTITGDGKQTRDFIYVSDVVRANILAMKSDKAGRGEVINIGSGKSQAINQIAKLIGGEVRYIPARFELKDSLADITLAKNLLGWIPKVTIEDGILMLKNGIIC